ncbi:leucine rich repeat domain containing protein [Grosmannia clavigera kw1407]|uniref:Leucine rich repeat domain containing protein n=1 Tax=Grosmannia clavigera (strain kw1407 / UAMH 11150) TaxID=655863 RepID=F0XQ21_GROCL|nr:leucine rich repeat domain containing protein [Grosmannia clavigera kw1407]EFX00604.1 leucine rich repeat domain containing protein [Grosmannia clavigera kw1407]
MDSEDGELFVKQLASFVRTHEKALANALQFRRQNSPRHGASQSVSSIPSSAMSASSPTFPERPATSSSTSNTLAAALSLGPLNFTSHTAKSAKLALTAHHLFYLLSRFEDLGIPVGPMGIRIENLHDAAASSNYVSFLSQSQRSKTHGSDVGSIRSVSSIRSVMSGMSALWASFGIGSSISAARTERQKAAVQADLKYLYSAFTKIPCLRLAPDWRARLIQGYEEFPFDSAVPLYVFKNVQALEVCDMDFRQFFGWDRLAEQLRSLTLKRASIEDPAEILVDIVLDDMDKRRRRTSKSQASPTNGPLSSSSMGLGTSPRRRSPSLHHAELRKSASMPGSPDPRGSGVDIRVGSVISEPIPDGDEHSEQISDGDRPSLGRSNSDDAAPGKPASRPRSHSPRRSSSSRNGGTTYVRVSHKVSRSGSGSSHSSLSDSWHNRRGSSSNLLSVGVIPAFKWRFLKHFSIADNSLTTIPALSLAPLSNTLHSLDLSSNLFTQIPDSLATLTALRALNLSHCMIDSLHSLIRYPLPAITALNLRDNRLQSIAGIEKLYSLERLDLRDNNLTDPMEVARLTGIPEIREVWVGGNPFTRTHRDYRITIFNLFRKTPGYTEDILIDASGPSYTEKKYLVDRAPLAPAVPVIKPPVAPMMPAVDVSKPAIIYDVPREPTVLRKERPAARAVTSETNSSASRRRRVPRRRIVDLATNDGTVRSAVVSQPSAPAASFGVELPASGVEAPLSPVAETNYRVVQTAERGIASPTSPNPPARVVSMQEAPETPRAQLALQTESQPKYYSVETQTQIQSHPESAAMVANIQTPPQSPIMSVAAPQTPTLLPIRTPTSHGSAVTAIWKEPQDWEVGAELYKRKIEALRDQVGEGYLSVLSEETWDSVRHPPQYHDNPFSNATASICTSPIAPRTANVQAIHSGRTLG